MLVVLLRLGAKQRNQKMLVFSALKASMHVLGHEQGIYVNELFILKHSPHKVHWNVTYLHTDISTAASRLLQ